jgi:SAM-dependent methyltransferase
VSKDYKEIKECLLCGGEVALVLPLAPTPPANELLEDLQEQDKFPLNLMKCVACNHLQLDTSVDRERLYRHYLYCSDTSQSNRTYFEGYATQMICRFFPGKTGQVLDIASNDGLFLSYFQQQGIKVLGVDPAQNLVEKAKEKDVFTLPEFFDEKASDAILQSYGKFPLITCNNAFAHNDDLRPILKGVKALLTYDGTFVVEVQYAMAMLRNGLFDVLYHEHIHSHHLMPLIKFFEDNGLRIYDAEEVATGWGSLRIYAAHFNTVNDPRFRFTFQRTQQMKNLMLQELGKIPQDDPDYFDKMFITPFVSKIKSNKNTLVSLLKEIKAAGKTISVLGHPARAMTLSYYFGLDEQIITDVFDDNTLKVGRYSPCTKKKILSTSDIYTRKPDYLLVLSWNYAEEIIKRFDNFYKDGGKFIIPLPEAKII